MNERQKRFVAHYLKDPNATSAAIAAGYSENGAEVTGHRLLRNPKIAEAVGAGRVKLMGRLEISAERVAQELARLAFYDPRKFFRDDGTAKEISALDDDTAAALAGIEVFEELQGQGEDRRLIGYTKKFKLPDKGANLERLGRHLGMFKDQVLDGKIVVVIEHIGTAHKAPT